MAGLPKTLIRKHNGNLKKAWAEHKRRRTTRKRKTAKKSTTRKRSVRRRAPVAKRRKVTRKKSSSSLFSGLATPAMAGVAYAVAEPVFDMVLEKVGISGVPRELSQIGAGIALAHFVPNKWTRSIRNASIIVNTYQLSRGFTGGLFSGLTGGATGNTGGVAVYG